MGNSSSSPTPATCDMKLDLQETQANHFYNKFQYEQDTYALGNSQSLSNYNDKNYNYLNQFIVPTDPSLFYASTGPNAPTSYSKITGKVESVSTLKSKLLESKYFTDKFDFNKKITNIEDDPRNFHNFEDIARSFFKVRRGKLRVDETKVPIFPETQDNQNFFFNKKTNTGNTFVINTFYKCWIIINLVNKLSDENFNTVVLKGTTNISNFKTKLIKATFKALYSKMKIQIEKHFISGFSKYINSTRQAYINYVNTHRAKSDSEGYRKFFIKNAFSKNNEVALPAIIFLKYEYKRWKKRLYDMQFPGPAEAPWHPRYIDWRMIPDYRLSHTAFPLRIYTKYAEILYFSRNWRKRQQGQSSVIKGLPIWDAYRNLLRKYELPKPEWDPFTVHYSYNSQMAYWFASGYNYHEDYYYGCSTQWYPGFDSISKNKVTNVHCYNDFHYNWNKNSFGTKAITSTTISQLQQDDAIATNTLIGICQRFMGYRDTSKKACTYSENLSFWEGIWADMQLTYSVALDQAEMAAMVVAGEIEGVYNEAEGHVEAGVTTAVDESGGFLEDRWNELGSAGSTVAGVFGFRGGDANDKFNTLKQKNKNTKKKYRGGQERTITHFVGSRALEWYEQGTYKYFNDKRYFVPVKFCPTEQGGDGRPRTSKDIRLFGTNDGDPRTDEGIGRWENNYFDVPCFNLDRKHFGKEEPYRSNVGFDTLGHFQNGTLYGDKTLSENYLDWEKKTNAPPEMYDDESAGPRSIFSISNKWPLEAKEVIWFWMSKEAEPNVGASDGVGKTKYHATFSKQEFDIRKEFYNDHIKDNTTYEKQKGIMTGAPDTPKLVLIKKLTKINEYLEHFEDELQFRANTASSNFSILENYIVNYITNSKNQINSIIFKNRESTIDFSTNYDNIAEIYLIDRIRTNLIRLKRSYNYNLQFDSYLNNLSQLQAELDYISEEFLSDNLNNYFSQEKLNSINYVNKNKREIIEALNKKIKQIENDIKKVKVTS